ncbi:tripartite motif-containing protein 51-like [Sminthopsis crassicaudata]|uniref:tripartite motif-containing protein 51-like n=1 Tax=Sminthopsis crassicaudata TaxID=9301 RepID=UPI003D68C44F
MAAIVKFLQELQSEITCSICRGYFCEPVTIGQVSQGRELQLVNWRLAELTELGKELSSKILQSSQGQSQCVTHKKLSSSCSKELQHIHSRLEEHLEEGEQLLAQVKRPAIDWDWMIRGEFFQLQQLLMEEEKRCLDRMRQDQKASQDRLSQHLQSLQELMQELQEAGRQANLDLLQDAKQLLGRSEAVLAQRAKAVTPELREYPIPGLIQMLHRFRVDLTMDATSAASCVSRSEDLKSAKAGEDWPEETEDPSCHAVLAGQAFSSGSHYWEVDVTQLPQWVLGIYTPYLRRKRTRDMDSCDFAFLLRCVKKEGEYYLQTYPGPLNHRIKGPLPRRRFRNQIITCVEVSCSAGAHRYHCCRKRRSSSNTCAATKALDVSVTD